AARRETVEVGTAANDVVLAKIAEDDIVPAVAFNIVVGVATTFEAGVDLQVGEHVAAQIKAAQGGRYRSAIGTESCEAGGQQIISNTGGEPQAQLRRGQLRRRASGSHANCAVTLNHVIAEFAKNL